MRQNEQREVSSDEPLYRRISQLTALLVAVGAITVLLLAIVTILFNARLGSLQDRVASVERRLLTLTPGPSGAAAAVANPVQPEDGRVAAAGSSNEPTPNQQVETLDSLLRRPAASRGARWREDVQSAFSSLIADPAAADAGTRQLAVRAALALDDFDAALPWGMAALANGRLDAESTIALARRGHALQRWSEALPFAEAAVQGTSPEPELYLVLADIQTQLKKDADALATWESALGFAATAPQAISRLTPILLAAGDTGRLRRALDSAERSAPGDAAVQRAEAAWALAAQQPDLALARLESLDGADEQAAELMLRLGRTLLEAQRFADAAKVFGRLAASRPDDAAAFDGLGVANLALHKLDAAEAAFETAARLDPQRAEAWYHLGVVRANRDQLDRALEALNRALELDDRRGDVYFARAVCLARQGNDDDAEEALTRAVALDARLLDQAAQVAAFRRMLGGPEGEGP